jgi:hypothetical protein
MNTGKKRLAGIVMLVLAAMLLTPSVWPWGPLGHRVAARMIEDRLSPAALAAVHDLLGPRVNLADISSWADEQPDISPNNAIVKIEDARQVLQNRSAGRQEKQQALQTLIHWIADLHQPTHAAVNGGKKGSRIAVRFYNAKSNLCRAWDSQIMERHTTNERVWLWDLNGVTNPKLVAEWSRGTPKDWAAESLDIGKIAFAMPGTNAAIRNGVRLGDDYNRMALPLIQKQLAKAAIRTAWTLNGIFKR